MLSEFEQRSSHYAALLTSQATSVLSLLHRASHIPYCLKMVHCSPPCKHNSLWPKLRRRRLASQVSYLPGSQLRMLRGRTHGWISRWGHSIHGCTLEPVYPALQSALLPSHCTAETQTSFSFCHSYLFILYYWRLNPGRTSHTVSQCSPTEVNRQQHPIVAPGHPLTFNPGSLP